VTPDVFSNAIRYFNDGNPVAAGEYTFAYSGGAVKWYSGFAEWTVGTADYDAESDGYYFLYNGGTALAKWPETADVSTDTAVPATQVGLSVTVSHTGGTIGVVMQDSDYGDNVISPTLGAPTFAISPCGCQTPTVLGLFNTGQASSTGIDSSSDSCNEDAHWSYNGGGAFLGGEAGGWYDASANSPTYDGRAYAWISPDCNHETRNIGTDNYYQTTFTIPTGTDLSVFELSGQFSTDNGLSDILVNGTSIANAGNVNFTVGNTLGVEQQGALNPFTIPTGSAFVIGSNTVRFQSYDDGGNGGMLVIWNNACDNESSSSSPSDHMMMVKPVAVKAAAPAAKPATKLRRPTRECGACSRAKRASGRR
jgi:hypothetical protein